MCKNGYTYLIGMVKHPAECQTLCESVSFQMEYCCAHENYVNVTLGKCFVHTGVFVKLPGKSDLQSATDCTTVPSQRQMFGIPSTSVIKAKFGITSTSVMMNAKWIV